jgi:hypothetical protein
MQQGPRDATVIVFGAGATRDCGGPLTDEILPKAFAADLSLTQQEDAIHLLSQFLEDRFPLQRQKPSQKYLKFSDQAMWLSSSVG